MDVVTQRHIGMVPELLQVIFIARLLTGGHVIFDKSFPELNLGVDGAFL